MALSLNSRTLPTRSPKFKTESRPRKAATAKAECARVAADRGPTMSKSTCSSNLSTARREQKNSTGTAGLRMAMKSYITDQMRTVTT